jgi:glucose/arabinose dehydrogenase
MVISEGANSLDLTPLHIPIFIGSLLVLIIAVSIYLPRQARLKLYAVLIAVILVVLGYFYYQFNLRPVDFATELVVSGLDHPVDAVPAPYDPDRFFVLERPGTVRLVDQGVLHDAPFLDLTAEVEWSGNEQGLLSMVFHPAYESNGIVYLYYTIAGDNSVLVSYEVDPAQPDTAVATSRRLLLEIEQPYPRHNGGLLAFGPDGYLYLSLGDGEGDTTAQDLSNLLGTMVRLDVSDPTADPPYTIPPDNPFLDTPEARPEIWAYGLRNPWRYDFDSLTGALFIADVGFDIREEINYQPPGAGAGANYGWPWFEGSRPHLPLPDTVTEADLTFPIAEYGHTAFGGCAVTGGYVYRGEALSELYGKYIYGDLCTGFIWSLEVTDELEGNVEIVMRTEGILLSSFAKDGHGELYLVNIREGEIHKLVKK